MMDRAQAVAAARSFIGTPYVLGGRKRGAGVDCATLLALYLIEIGAETEEIWKGLKLYRGDWFLHSQNELYLAGLMRFGYQTSLAIARADAQAEPGDLALFRSVRSRHFNHGAIVTSWPYGIHAAVGGVREINLTADRLTAYREMEIFDPFAKSEAGP